MEGAILISRALIDSEVFASEKLLKIWIWLLIKANFRERQVPIKIGAGQSVVTIKRGQLLFGRLSAENELFIDGSTIYKCIKKLETLKNIEIKSNSHYSIITICNYDHYQDMNSYKVAAKRQPRNKQVTATEQPSNTPNNDNKENNVYTELGWSNDPELFDKLRGKYPKLFTLKYPLSHNEHIALIKDWTPEKVRDIYSEMQNYAKLESKSESANLTARNWLTRNKKREAANVR